MQASRLHSKGLQVLKWQASRLHSNSNSTIEKHYSNDILVEKIQSRL